MADDEISTRLLTSDPVASLQAEQDVVAAFKRLSWWTVEHGPLYRDPDTGKLRELDVRATRMFLQGRDEMPVFLQVLVELKSMRGFHLVFAPSPDDRQSTRAQRAWIGHSKDPLRRCLADNHVPTDVIADALTRFDRLAFSPSGARHSALEPTQAAVVATAFRETNVKSEKELDTSVVWRAIQALTSCIDAARARAETNYLGDVPYALEAARNAGGDWAEAIEKVVAPVISRIEFYHPAVVTDARLWVSRDGTLTEVDHVRLKPGDPDVLSTRWFDIVARRSFDTWVHAVTRHYRQSLEHAEEANVRRSAAAISSIFDALQDVVVNPALDLRMQIRDRDSGMVKRMRLVRSPREEEPPQTPH